MLYYNSKIIYKLCTTLLQHYACKWKYNWHQFHLVLFYFSTLIFRSKGCSFLISFSAASTWTWVLFKVCLSPISAWAFSNFSKATAHINFIPYRAEYSTHIEAFQTPFYSDGGGKTLRGKRAFGVTKLPWYVCWSCITFI